MSAAVLAVALIAGCSSSAQPAGPTLLVPHDNGSKAAVQMPHVDRNTPWFFLTDPLCASGGAVTPTSVTPTNPTGGLTVVDWGVNAVDSGIGAAPGRVADLPGYNHGPITADCNGDGVNLNVSVKAPASVASSDSFVIHYKGGSLTIPFAVMICTGKCPDKKTS